MPSPQGFVYSVRKSGDVVITHEGRAAGVLRGRVAERFLEDVTKRDPQQVMARVTGQYRHGNERVAKQHHRNRADTEGPGLQGVWGPNASNAAGGSAAEDA